MKTQKFIDYKKFLQMAYLSRNDIQSFTYRDGRLLSFRTNQKRYKFLIDTGVLSPNKFVKLLGFGGYASFVKKRFDKLKDIGGSADLWYAGFMGGLVGLNRHNINDYIGAGEVFDIYDYDINSAYLTQMTNFLPTRLNRTLSPKEYFALKESDKVPYIYFFEIELLKRKSKYYSVIGEIREKYKSFDFLNAKQKTKMIVSEKRLELIDKIYMPSFCVKKVFEFKRERFNFYTNILHEYLQLKKQYGKEFKQSALMLYGLLGQIYKRTPKKLFFDNDGRLMVEYKKEINELASPQISMWVADNVACKLFEVVTANYDKIISWNTDGVTATCKLPLQVSSQAGKWKLQRFKGTPFLLTDNGCRVFYKNYDNNTIVGANNIFEQDGKFLEVIEEHFSTLQRGYVVEQKMFHVKQYEKYNESQTFRNLILRDIFVHDILREYVQQF